MRTTHVVVLPYDPAWKADFAAIRQELASALDGLAIAIEHVGSTSVEGLSAKPCIDIDAVMPDYSVFPQIVERLAAIGYTHEGDLGIPGREAFCYTDKPHLRLHHLYVCPADSEELHRHLVFRDFLRTHPEAVARYSRRLWRATAPVRRTLRAVSRRISRAIWRAKAPASRHFTSCAA